MRRFAVTISFVALCTPVFAGALSVDDLKAQINLLLQQIAALQAQAGSVQNSSVTQSSVTANPSAAQCTFSRTLSLGSVGADVSSLQNYLIAQGALSATIASATFDASTQAALQSWQASHGIVSSGTASTTGYGVFGPRTRALLAINCALPGSSNSQSVCPLAPQPTLPCAGTWSAITTTNGCTTAWQCAVPLPGTGTVQNTCNAITLSCPTGTHLQTASNCFQSCVAGTLAPATTGTVNTNGFSATPTVGPASLFVTFSANGVAPDTYSVNFGDANASQLFSQTCTSTTCNYQITHGYSFPGTYTATLSGTHSTLGTVSINVTPVQSQVESPAQISSQSTLAPYCPVFQSPSCSNGTLVDQGYDANGCKRAWQCVSNPTTPTICPVTTRPACPTGQHYETGNPPTIATTPGCTTSNLVCVADY